MIMRGHRNRGTLKAGRSKAGKPNRIFLTLYKSLPNSRLLRLATSMCATVALLMYSFSFFLWIFRHSQCYSREAFVTWKEAPSHDPKSGIVRRCPSIGYQSIYKAQQTTIPRICLASLTDQYSNSMFQRLLRCRDFDVVGNLTRTNQKAYAKKHGYIHFDGSHRVDVSRPPAWSKIPVVTELLSREQADGSKLCEWVWWLDADIVVMNSSIPVSAYIPSDPRIHLIATPDRRLFVNSGSWIVRNNQWSRNFLKSWWGMKNFVRQPGLSLSGDNAAFGRLVESLVATNEGQKIRIIPKCTINSFGAFVRHNFSSDPHSQVWFKSEDFYHSGDFVAHASGVDQKASVLGLLLARAM